MTGWLNIVRDDGAIMVYIVTGTPGTGKHTLARAAAHILDVDMIDTIKVAERAGILDPSGLDVSQLADILQDTPDTAIVVGHLAHHAISPAVATSIVVLRRSPYELEYVYGERQYTHQKALDNLGAEILGLIAAEAALTFGDDTTQMDVTGHDIHTNTNRLLTALRGELKSDDVDWLGMIYGDGTARRFFDI